MKPYDYQIALGLMGYGILKANGLVYYACEERTGKTLSAILCAEHRAADTGETELLVITKKKALKGWQETVAQYKSKLNIHVTTFHQVQKLPERRWSLVIIDEAHSYVSGFPKPSQMWKTIKGVVYGAEIIYASATPHAQGYHLLYHQLALSSCSPWRRYNNFYAWHRQFGEPYTIWVSGREVNQYDRCDDELVRGTVDHLFITKTRAELGFEQEPEDVLHYIDLGDNAKYVYNHLLKHKWVQLSVGRLVCDTGSKLRYALHMLEGGVCKVEKDYFSLANSEKIDYID